MDALSVLGEVGLIERIKRRVGGTPTALIGIGDDAAVLPWRRGEHLLLASDMLVENIHFRRGEVRADQIGWKALACNISDIAAMGGQPTYAVVSLGLPPATPVRFVDHLYGGLTRCARRFGVALVGGDSVRAPCVVVDVAIMGTVKASHCVLRSGARVGDRIFVTGRLGGSLRSGRHATFIPRLREAQWLVRHVSVHAMLDLSDGLASDLWQLARASRVSLRVRETAIPLTRAAQACVRGSCPCRRWRAKRAVWHALMDGEDFELLFVVPPRAARRIPRRIGQVPVTEIGSVVARGAQVELVRADGCIAPVTPQGFRHF